MESLPHMERFDIHLIGYSDAITQALAHKLGWTWPKDTVLKYELDQALSYRVGEEPWKSFFEGGMEKPHQHSEDESSETASDMTPDTPISSEGEVPLERERFQSIVHETQEEPIELGTQFEFSEQ
jgi:hypothetical protein